MELSVRVFKRCVLIHLSGRINGITAPEFGAKLTSLMRGGYHKFVINMADVSFISSAGVRELISIWKGCRTYNRGDVFFAELNVTVDKVFDLYGLKNMFAIFVTEAEAVGNF